MSTAIEREREREPGHPERDPADHDWFPLVGHSAAMRRLFAVLQRVATTSTTVLLEGETGTGKSSAARLIHRHSARRGGPYVVVDCAALPGSLIDSHLFGHERGAFTGAHVSRTGSIESADGGTLFLDEIGELPLELQTKLLQFLEERTVARVGSSRSTAVDVRIIAATNRDLRAEVERGAFRSDLFHRLDVLRVVMPPLRARAEDVPLLIRHFYRRFAGDLDPSPPADLLTELCGRPWPGNVRELRNAVERRVLLADPALWEELDARQWTPDGACEPEPACFDPTTTYAAAKERMIEAWERRYVAELMHRAGHNVSRAATAAGMNRTHLQRVLHRCGVLRTRKAHS